MEATTKLGMNRTGIQMSPFDSKKMQQPSQNTGEPLQSPPQSTIRESYLIETEVIGSVPLPTTLSGIVQSTKDMITGNQPQVLIDKLGERLAFERSGVRLYEAIIAKCYARAEEIEESIIDELIHFKDEEAQHFKMVHDAMVSLGADPTAETPCADIAGVASMGLVKVITDPRTDLSQSLNAILSAELIDNAGWEALIDLAQKAKHEDLANQFEVALREEDQHLQTVKQWLLEMQSAALRGETLSAETRH